MQQLCTFSWLDKTSLHIWILIQQYVLGSLLHAVWVRVLSSHTDFAPTPCIRKQNIYLRFRFSSYNMQSCILYQGKIFAFCLIILEKEIVSLKKK